MLCILLAKLEAILEGQVQKKHFPLTLKKIEKVLESLANGAGIAESCNAVGLAYQTFYDWIKESPANAQKVFHIHDSLTFIVENALYKKALAGDVIAMIFWLKNRSQDRWRDTHYQNQEIKATLHADFEKMSDEDIDKELARILNGSADKDKAKSGV